MYLGVYSGFEIIAVALVGLLVWYELRPHIVSSLITCHVQALFHHHGYKVWTEAALVYTYDSDIVSSTAILDLNLILI